MQKLTPIGIPLVPDPPQSKLRAVDQNGNYNPSLHSETTIPDFSKQLF
ncbi:hypothetical protein [Paenibacillus taiwanensis]|nr:hypothetical protein [Paenibacillus taiwanensis]